MRIHRLRKNPWLARPRRERLGFALAAFCLFAPIRILNQLLRLPATPRPFGFAMLSLKEFMHLVPPLLCEQIYECSVKHRGNQLQQDDITLVAIRQGRTFAV